MCRNIGGAQAQVLSAANLALWTRKRTITPSDIEAALYETRELVKTSCMRQTLHLIPADDFWLYINALKRSRVDAMFNIMQRFGVTHQEYDALKSSIVDALDSDALPHGELIARILPQLSQRTRTCIDHLWSGMAVRPAVIEGLICYGPPLGRGITFVRVDHWLPAQQQVAESDAKLNLLRRYLGAYGPATVQDFARWAGMPLAEARQVWQSLHDELEPVTLDGRQTMLLHHDLNQLADAYLPRSILRLLPHFDPFLLGHVDKSPFVDDKHYKKVYRQAGWISPTIVLDGRVIGTWSQSKRAAHVQIAVQPFGRLTTASRQAIERETVGLAAFQGTSAEVAFEA